MSVIFLLISASTLVALVFLAAFIKAVRSGQFDDDRSPAVRILMDDELRRKGAKDEWSLANGPTTRPPSTSDHQPLVDRAVLQHLTPPDPATRTIIP